MVENLPPLGSAWIDVPPDLPKEFYNPGESLVMDRDSYSVAVRYAHPPSEDALRDLCERVASLGTSHGGQPLNGYYAENVSLRRREEFGLEFEIHNGKPFFISLAVAEVVKNWGDQNVISLNLLLDYHSQRCCHPQQLEKLSSVSDVLSGAVYATPSYRRKSIWPSLFSGISLKTRKTGDLYLVEH